MIAAVLRRVLRRPGTPTAGARPVGLRGAAQAQPPERWSGSAGRG